MTTTDAETTPSDRMPVEAKARIGSLDALRGVAVLGILAVNAASFALPFMVYDDPALSPFPVVGDNALARWAVEVFFQQCVLHKDRSDNTDLCYRCTTAHAQVPQDPGLL